MVNLFYTYRSSFIISILRELFNEKMNDKEDITMDFYKTIYLKIHGVSGQKLIAVIIFAM